MPLKTYPPIPRESAGQRSDGQDPGTNLRKEGKMEEEESVGKLLLQVARHMKFGGSLSDSYQRKLVADILEEFATLCAIEEINSLWDLNHLVKRLHLEALAVTKENAPTKVRYKLRWAIGRHLFKNPDRVFKELSSCLEHGPQGWKIRIPPGQGVPEGLFSIETAVDRFALIY